MKKRVFGFLFTILAVSSAIAGPFGIDKGMGLAEVQKQGKFLPGKSPNMYRAYQLKNGHDAFDFYEVLISPRHGVCRIFAAGKTIQSNAFGGQVKSSFLSLEAALMKKYGGSPNQYDFLRSGSIWSDDGDWMMALYKEERVLATIWSDRPLPDSLKAIMLEANALSSAKAWISLHYEFDNIDVCLEEAKQKRNSNL